MKYCEEHGHNYEVVMLQYSEVNRFYVCLQCGQILKFDLNILIRNMPPTPPPIA